MSVFFTLLARGGYITGSLFILVKINFVVGGYLAQKLAVKMSPMQGLRRRGESRFRENMEKGG